MDDARTVFSEQILLGDPQNRGNPGKLTSYAVREKLPDAFAAWFTRVTTAARYAHQARPLDDVPECDQCGHPFDGGDTVFQYCSDVDFVPGNEMGEPYAQRAYCTVCRPYVPRFPSQSANEIIIGFTFEDDFARTDPLAISWSPKGHGIPWTPTIFREEYIRTSIRNQQLETHGPADDVDLLINLGAAPEDILDQEGSIANPKTVREINDQIDEMSSLFPQLSGAAQSGQVQDQVTSYRNRHGISLDDVRARIRDAT